ncbi:nitroreductase family protein [Vagococcus humatus]|uniref:Nitroreductase n=1 Tax=Vagococcus humatus TaxID=1889241 RepID=A0A3S0AC50_9ENTE|nr:nitroreductase family protein [Vagococcus humatus]RST89415.1 nitroreductase [Vagococcus humatus]
MTSQFLTALKKRRSIYDLGDKLSINQQDLVTLVKEVVKESPSAFNSQTQRVVFLFGDAHKKLWEITEAALKPLTPPEAFSGTQAKLASFAKGYGTLLFFEDQAVVTHLQEQFPLYAANFPIWSEQASGLTQANVWTALAEQNIGANLQHYNPVIDEQVAAQWNIPKEWQLRAQMVVGSIESLPGEKEYMDDTTRFLSFD